MEEAAQRFKVGQKVTYKRRKNCKDGRYAFGGEEPRTFAQEVLCYLEFHSHRGCWKIDVTHGHGNYYMYEDEFEEFDATPVENTAEITDYEIF